MREVTFFRTMSLGGMCGRDVITKNFETEEMAREDAMRDTWNSDYFLYKVTMTFDGIITERKESLGEIPCPRAIQALKSAQEYIEKMKAEIEIEKNNKKIKETTREKRIKSLEQRIAWEEETVREYQKVLENKKG